MRMTDASYPQNDTAESNDRTDGSDSVALPPPSERAPLKAVVVSILRALVSLALVMWIYSNWDPKFGDSSAIIFMSIGFLLFIAWTVWQGRRIVHAQYPGLRAVEVLATVIPFFVIVFASTYYSMSVENNAAFNQVLDKGSSLYFTIVVLSTTGFGDIVPRSGWARAAVNTQMLIDLFFIALIIRFIVGAVGKGREMRAQGIPPRKVIPGKLRSKGTDA